MKGMPTKKEGLLRPHIKPVGVRFPHLLYFKSLIRKKACNSGSYKHLMSETLKKKQNQCIVTSLSFVQTIYQLLAHMACTVYSLGHFIKQWHVYQEVFLKSR